MLKKHIVFNPFSDWRFDFKKASGPYIWTVEGKKLIDFTSGWNVTNLGWNHPEITEAIIKQLEKTTYAPAWTICEIQEEYAQALTDSLPPGLTAIERATGGTEANEEALKTARAYTGRKKIISFKNTYHGQSFATIAVGFPEYMGSIAPFMEGIIRVEFPTTSGTYLGPEIILRNFATTLEKILEKEDVAALITEPRIITGWGSTYTAPEGYLKVVRKLTKKYGTLLILDEVGTGFSRCGKLYGMELEGITPDIVTLAKGMSNGAAPIGAMITTEEIAKKPLDKTNPFSTFGWTPVACAAALKTLQIHQRDKEWIKAEKDGEYLINTLKKELKNHQRVGEIRGIGMEIGIEFLDKERANPDREYARQVVDAAYKKGLHLTLGDGGNIQIMPPLTIEREVLDRGIDILIDSINHVN